MKLEYKYLIVSAILAAGVYAYSCSQQSKSNALLTYRSRPIVAELKVDSVEGWDGTRKGWGSFQSELDGEPVKVIAELPPEQASPEVGEIWKVTAWCGKVQGGVRKLWIRGSDTGMEKVRDLPGKSFWVTLKRMRQFLSRRLGAGLEREPEFADLHRAILLGERRRMAYETREMFIAAGTIHVFAISGLHVMVVVGVMMCFLRLFLVPPRLAGLVIQPLIWLYVLLIGMPPSATRAATMASFFFLARVFNRQSNGIISWSVAFIVIHLVSPRAILLVGDVMSFAVMLGIILMSRYVKMFLNHRYDFLWISFAAWASGVPIAAHVFGRVTPGAIVANLFLTPIATVDVCVSFVSMLVGACSIRLAATFNSLTMLITKLMYGISFVGARIPYGSIDVRPWNALYILEWYALIFLVLYLLRSIYLRRLSTIS